MFYIKTGQILRVHLNCTKKRSAESKIIKGKVIFLNDHYFTLQCKNYKESVSFEDLCTGDSVILI